MSWLFELAQTLVYVFIVLGILLAAFLLWVSPHKSEVSQPRTGSPNSHRRRAGSPNHHVRRIGSPNNHLRRSSGSSSSDSIAMEIMQTWARLEARHPKDTLGCLARETGIPFRTLDFARRVRNDVAHKGADVPGDRLLGAVRILRQAERQVTL